MNRPSYKIVLSSLAAISAIMVLSSCGEKKVVHPAAGSPAPKQGEEAPTNPGGEGGGGGGGIEIPAAPETEGGADQKSPKPLKEDSNSGYDPSNPSQIDEERFTKRYTGAKDSSGLLYTGSAPDSLLTFLRMRSEGKNIDSETKARNTKAAMSVLSARIDRTSDEFNIVLELSEAGSSKNYVLTGARSQNRVTVLEVTQKTGTQKIEASIKCMDANRGCETSMLKLLIGEPGTRSVVRILFRDSLADVFANLPGKRSANPEYESMRSFWINSILNIETDEKMKEIRFKAFEVVNGRSGFEVQIWGHNGELMIYSGPLLAPEVGTKIDIQAESGDAWVNSSSNLANSVGSARIINNNGLGQIKLDLTMRPRGGYDQDAFKLTIMRLVRPILPLTERSIEM